MRRGRDTADDRQTHTFRGRSMQDAVRRLKATLGPDAVIVSTRRGRDQRGRYVEISAVPDPRPAPTAAEPTAALGGRRGASAAYARTALATQPAELPPLLAALRGEQTPDKPFAERAAWLARQIELRTAEDEQARAVARAPSLAETWRAAPHATPHEVHAAATHSAPAYAAPARRRPSRPPYHAVDPLPDFDNPARILTPAEAAAELARPPAPAGDIERLQNELDELRSLIGSMGGHAPAPQSSTPPVVAALVAALAPITERLEALARTEAPVQTQLADIRALLQQVTGGTPAVAPAPEPAAEAEPAPAAEAEPEPVPEPARPVVELTPIVERLTAAGVARAHAVDIARRATPRTLRPVDPMTRVSRIIAEDIDCGSARLEHRILAFIGPTGVGKTTTIAKIASRARLAGKSVALLTVDTFRMAAVDQLARYAEVLDAPLTVVKHPEDLGPALEACADADLVLVDTTGRNPRAPDQVRALERFFPEGWGGELVLTVAGNTREADAFATIDAFGELGYGLVCVTKMDETDAPGAIYGIARRSGRPVAWTTDGQMVPDDIEEADATTIAARIVGHRPRAAFAVGA